MPETDATTDVTDSNIDAYLLSKNPIGGKPQPLSPPQGDSGTQPSGADFDKMLSSMPKMPSPPKLRDVPSAPQQQYHSPYQDFSGPAMFLVALGSMMTRHPMKVAMDSFSAMVHADVQGQKEVMENARENWKASMEVATRQNEVEIERYKMVMEKYKEDANAAAAHMMAMASGFNDPMMAAMVRTGDMANVWNYIQDREKRGQQLAEFALKQREQDEKERHNKTMEGDMSAAEGDAQAIADYRKPPYTGYAARSPQARLAMQRVFEINPDYDATKYDAKKATATTAARVGTTRSVNLELIQRNLEAAIPQAEQASAKLPRGEWVPLNRVIQQGKIATSDPAYYEFAQTNLQVAELWARAMNPTGIMREGDRDLALTILGTATSPETYKRQLQVLRNFVQRERQVTTEFREGKEPTAPGGSAADAAGSPDNPANSKGWSIERVQ